MKIFLRGSSLLLLAGLAALTCAGSRVQAQQVAPGAASGFTRQICLGSSDTIISVPLTRKPVYQGTVQSVAGSTITVAGSPNWAAGKFVYAAGTQPNTYFALLGHHATANPKEGRFYTVTGSTTTTLTVLLEGEDLQAVAQGTPVSILPYHTLNTLFPADDAGFSYTPSVSQFNRQTQVLIPNYSGIGTNLSANVTYYYLNGAWRKYGDSLTTDFGNDVLLPGRYVILRNSGTASTTLTSAGSVLQTNLTLPLVTSNSIKQDNMVSVLRPVGVRVDELGLISSGAFAPSYSTFNRIDELLVYNNAPVSFNKSASTTYYFYNNAWRKYGSTTTTDFGSDLIPAGAGFIIRKGSTADGSSQPWSNSPGYAVPPSNS